MYKVCVVQFDTHAEQNGHTIQNTSDNVFTNANHGGRAI
jgi:hypothetical protein